MVVHTEAYEIKVDGFQFHLKFDVRVLDLELEHMGEHCVLHTYVYTPYTFFSHS